YIRPLRPIPIEGITKTISVWVVGRNYNHVLKVVLQDFFGREYELYMGRLNFQGWKKLTVAIPPQSPDGKSGIVQRDYHYNSKMGLKIIGFKVECDPMEAYGSYYIYFDDLRAVTDLFAEENRDPDDMVDTW
ncbi:MAG: flagellar filament outer layer protein FlaA, partial [Treponemataceae bacterium]|nr:flagellar filament outer layer protein FlaA [Treponemataceae bacterium]